MSARRSIEGRIFAALQEEGPLLREELAQRATLTADIKRALRIMRDLVETEDLVEQHDGRLALPPKDADRDRYLSLMRKMMERRRQREASYPMQGDDDD